MVTCSRCSGTGRSLLGGKCGACAGRGEVSNFVDAVVPLAIAIFAIFVVVMVLIH